jgi:biotin transport system substrate-specific component
MKIKHSFTTKQLTISAIFLALIIIGGFIKIPVGIVPITLQLLFVLLAAQLLSPKLTVFTILTYIFLGLVGLPIFSNGGGIGYVLMPNFGFIIGFLIATVIISVITQKLQNRKLWQHIVISLLGITVIYIIGILYFVFITNVYNKCDYSAIWFIQTIFLPFLPKEIICIILASISAYKIRPYITKIPQ